ncbi:hypothetical protein JCM33374_g4989 [Metschnikowia sp. JCM 33374]|nr:hypothetical protein JCM33374_g4989 [Metschnikowia sp. JCM 33374]
MVKKTKVRNKRRGLKKGGPGRASSDTHRDHSPQEIPLSHPGDPLHASGGYFGVNSSSHANVDDSRLRHLVHPDEGAVNNRAPLTGRNLQTLLEQNDPAYRRRQSGVALDMDQYAREQNQYDKSYAGHTDHDDVSLYSHDSRESSLEFGESNPSSDHSSDSTSLDDVCFPDYYEGLRDNGTTETAAWPDLRILEEFIVEEQEDLKEAMDEVPSGVNFQFPVARKVSALADPSAKPSGTDLAMFAGSVGAHLAMGCCPPPRSRLSSTSFM